MDISENLALEDLIREAISKIGGKNEASICRFLPFETNGYMHYFTLRKMKLQNPEKLYKLIQTHIIQIENPQEIPAGPSQLPVAKSIDVGSFYEHYKGLRYKILAIAHHSETFEELVVYQALYGEGKIWVRPRVMFLENILIHGQLKPRFISV